MPAKNGNKSKNRRSGQRQRPAVERAPVAVAPPADATADRYAPTAWQDGSVELTLPSGQLCLVRRVGVQKLMEEGVLDNFDSLTGIVQTKHINKKARNSGPQRKQDDIDADLMLRKLMKDPDKLREAISVMDKVVMATVVLPEILPVPDASEERKPGAAYIDWVADDDKAYVMNFAFGGTRDLERFRRELAELGDGVDNGEDVEDPA